MTSNFIKKVFPTPGNITVVFIHENAFSSTMTILQKFRMIKKLF